jgi:hypothetical protein
MLFHVTSFRWHFVNIVYPVSELWPVWQWLAWSQFTRSKPERCSIWTNVNTSSYVTDNSLVALLGNQEHFVEESILYILCKNCIVHTIILSTDLLPVSFQKLIISHWWIHEFLTSRFLTVVWTGNRDYSLGLSSLLVFLWKPLRFVNGFVSILRWIYHEIIFGRAFR